MKVSYLSTLVLAALHLAEARPQITATTPANCKVIRGDKDWPTQALWTQELTGTVQTPRKSDNTSSTDYTYVARNYSDVAAAVKFASKYNLRLSIINSGHDFLGRNDAASGLWLAVGNLKGVFVFEGYNPTREGVPPVNASAEPVSTANVIQHNPGKQAYVTFGAGVSSQELYDALNKSRLVTVGAASSTVKVAGGFGQTAGHGPLSSRLGLASDLIVEYKVVTADGNIRVANSVSNPDLFWALRGGGGGTFGVVVEATMKAFPTPKLTMIRWWLKTENSTDTKSIFSPSAYILSQMPALNEKGAMGYFYIYPNAIWGMMLTAEEDAGIAKTKKLWEPVLSVAEKFPGVQKVITQYANFDDFKQWFDWRFQRLPPKEARSPARLEGARPRGGVSAMDSRLLGVSHLRNPMLASALQGAMPQMKNGMLRGHLIGGGEVINANRGPPRSERSSSVNPAWRRTYIHLIATGYANPDATTLKLLAPDSGCYANECSYQETNFKRTMWGPNYNSLRTIKRRYDPNGLFWVTPGVGADDYTVSHGRVCRVVTANQTASLQSPYLANPNGLSPASDNNNFAHDETNAFQTMPETQAQADAEAPKLGKWS